MPSALPSDDISQAMKLIGNRSSYRKSQPLWWAITASRNPNIAQRVDILWTLAITSAKENGPISLE